MEPLTFLFTDIEGSTRRWEDHPDAMRGALEVHDRWLRDAVESNSGLVFKHTGDGICAVFRSAPDAVDAAIELQRRIGAGDWAAVGGLRVRAGLHTGTATERSGDYFGPALNRCARLMSAANGGQVLVSESTAVALGRDFVEGALLVDLGEHRLKDLTEPSRIFHLTAVGLTPLADLPALRTLDTHRHNLPTMVSSFVGREAELAELHDRLARSRLVTLTGVGGTGKTRLALQAAAERVDRYTDGVYFADLAQTSNTDEVGAAVASALRIARTAGTIDADARTLAETMADDLGLRSELLVLDNCEHVLDGVVPLVTTLLARAPNLAVLATSREALGLAGESVQAVAPLRDDEGVALFLERGREAGSLSGDDAMAAVGEIVRRLDGIPLALELAAARLRSLSATEIAERLHDRFRLLVGARRSLERQQTLRATMDWSYSLLSPTERQLLARLSVFEGGFTMGAAEAVASGDGVDEYDVVDLLDDLVTKSLVTRRETGGRTRFGLLETVRQYAAERLAGDGDPIALRHRHLAWALRTAHEWDPAIGYQEMMELTPPEHANLRAALEWAIELGDAEASLKLCDALILVWFNLGHFHEGTRLIDATLALGGGSCRDRYYRSINATYLHMWVRQRDQAIEKARSALRIADACPDVPSPHLAHLILGVLGILDMTGLDHVLVGRALAEQAGDQGDVLFSKFLESQYLANAGRLEEALVLVSEAAQAPFTVDTGWVIVAQLTEALFLFLAGRDARAAAERALASARRAGNQTSIVTDMVIAAMAREDRGRLTEAVTESRRLWGRVHAVCLIGAAVLASRRGDHEAAAVLTGASTNALDIGSGSILFDTQLRGLVERPTEEWRRGFAAGAASNPEDVIDRFVARSA